MVTAKEAVKEQVPGLPQSPVDGGKFVVRKVKETTVDEGTSFPAVPGQSYTRELVLVIKGEDEYSVPLFNTDDSAIINGTYQVIQLRRSKLREGVFNDNDEVELTQ